VFLLNFIFFPYRKIETIAFILLLSRIAQFLKDIAKNKTKQNKTKNPNQNKPKQPNKQKRNLLGCLPVNLLFLPCTKAENKRETDLGSSERLVVGNRKLPTVLYCPEV